MTNETQSTAEGNKSALNDLVMPWIKVYERQPNLKEMVSVITITSSIAATLTPNCDNNCDD